MAEIKKLDFLKDVIKDLATAPSREQGSKSKLPEKFPETLKKSAQEDSFKSIEKHNPKVTYQFEKLETGNSWLV